MPELELIRLDADTAAKPGAADRGARAASPTTDRAVLLGTQMVAKGHHFAGVALAAVVDADTGLGLPDFRAEERTFQLITQLAGRSGRDAPGRVLVQTFQPDARADRATRRATTSRGFLDGRARAPARARLPAVPPPRPDRRLRARPGAAAAARSEELRAGLAGRARAARPGAAPAPARPLPRAARREDGAAARASPREPARLLAAAAPAMRRAGLTAVVDVDPQSL